MRSLNEVGGEELQWVKPKWFRRQYELRAGDSVVATLARTGATGAVGAWSGGQYYFSQKGWFHPRIFVRRDPATGDDTPLATYTRRESTVAFEDGRAISWRKPSIWRSKRVWMASETPLVEFDPASGYKPANVTITPEGAGLTELPLLLLLGEYLIVRAREEADAASAATTSTVIASS